MATRVRTLSRMHQELIGVFTWLIHSFNNGFLLFLNKNVSVKIFKLLVNSLFLSLEVFVLNIFISILGTTKRVWFLFWNFLRLLNYVDFDHFLHVIAFIFILLYIHMLGHPISIKRPRHTFLRFLFELRLLHFTQILLSQERQVFRVIGIVELVFFTALVWSLRTLAWSIAQLNVYLLRLIQSIS